MQKAIEFSCFLQHYTFSRIHDGYENKICFVVSSLLWVCNPTGGENNQGINYDK